MSFLTATRPRADEAYDLADQVQQEVIRLRDQAKTKGSREFATAVANLAECVKVLARLAGRRYPEQIEDDAAFNAIRKALK